MGCWNATCALSRYPIHAGEPVVAFPVLLESHGRPHLGGGFCEPTDLAQPLTPGIRGSYNDYGGVEDLEPQQLSSFRAWLELAADQALFVGERGRPARFESDDVQSWLNEHVERGKLFVRTSASRKPALRPVGMMLVHRKLHDDLVIAKGKERPWRNPRSTVRKDVEAGLLATLEAPRLDNETAMLARMALSSLVAESPMFYKAFVQAQGRRKRNPALRDVVDLRLLNYVLHELRAHWGVCAGVGSQSSFSTLHDALLGFMRGHLVEHRRQEAA